MTHMTPTRARKLLNELRAELKMPLHPAYRYVVVDRIEALQTFLDWV